jgi:hypothetical protein
MFGASIATAEIIARWTLNDNGSMNPGFTSSASLCHYPSMTREKLEV